MALWHQPAKAAMAAIIEYQWRRCRNAAA